ncbi:MAG: hypothetical protein WD712_02855 [Candidatus Spechtbacterales bacterium]
MDTMQDNKDIKVKTVSKKSITQTLETAVFCAFLFLTPLFFLPFGASPVPFSKQILAGTVLAGLFVCMLIRFLTAGKITLPSRYISLGLLGLFLSVLVSAIFSKARSVSFLGSSPDSLFWVGMYVLVFFLAAIVLKNRKAIIAAFFSYMGGIAVLAIFALLQFSGFRVLPFGFASDVNFNPIGSVFVLGVVVSAGLLGLLAYLTDHKPQSMGMRSILYITVGVLAVLVIQINLWAVWVGAALTFIIVAFTQSYRVMRGQKDYMPKLPMLPMFIVMVAILALFVLRFIPIFISVPAELTPTFGTTLDITKNSLEGTSAIYGTGPGTFPYNYSAHRPIEINQTDFWGVQFNQGYSAFLTYISTWGLLGAIVFVLALLLITWKLLKGYLDILKNKNPDLVLRGIVLAMLSSVLFLLLLIFIYQGNSVIHIMLFASAGIGFSALRELGALKVVQLNLMLSPKAMFVSSVISVALVGVAVGTLYFLGLSYVSNIYAAQGIDIFNKEQDINKTLDKMDTAVFIYSGDDFVLRAASQAFVVKFNQIMNDQTLKQEERDNQATAALQNAVNLADRATKVNPAQGQNWVQLAKVYEMVIGLIGGVEERALDAYGKAIELDPLNPSLPLAKAGVYMSSADALRAQLNALSQENGDVAKESEILSERKDRLAKAIELIRHSISLKNDYSNARLALASAYGRQGDIDGAIAEIKEAILTSPRDPNLFFQLGLYQFENNNFGDASVSFETAINFAGGNFANARFYLGLSHDSVGDKQKAIEQFETILKDNADNELIKSIIVNLGGGRPALEGLEQPAGETPLSETGGSEEIFAE